jgi:hypothetical protein
VAAPKLQLIAGGRRRLEERALVACFEDPDVFERLLRQLTPASNGRLGAYFSPSWTAFQADRGRDFSVIVDGVSV